MKQLKLNFGYKPELDYKEIENSLKRSYFDGFEYHGVMVKTKFVFEGREEFRPMRFEKPEDVYNEFKKLRESDKERFYSLLLDSKNKVMGVDFVSQGTLERADVHPREVYKSAIISSPSSVIFVHSHPSGDPLPSESDRQITKILKNAGDIIGVRVLDHIIIGDGVYYSFADSGELEK